MKKHISLMFILMSLTLIGCGKSSPQTPENASAALRYLCADLSRQEPSLGKLKLLDRELQFTPQLIRWKLAWEWPFPSNAATVVIQKQQIPYIVLDLSTYKDEPELLYSSILDGDWDEYLADWATDAKEFEYPILLELALPDTPIAAEIFAHVLKIFQEQEAVNIKWVWEVNSVPAPTAANWLRMIPPISNSTSLKIVDFRDQEKLPTADMTSPQIWLITPEKVKATLHSKDFMGNPDKLNLL